jgi:ABC-type transport system substrate-binding protein
VQLVQRYLKDVGIEAELKLQEYDAYMATTVQGKYQDMVYGPTGGVRDPDGPLYGRYIPDHPLNRSYVNDSKMTSMLKEQRRTKDLEARKEIIYAFQRYEAEQQYYVYANSAMLTGSWQPYVKNYALNLTFNDGSRVAVLWLER